MTGLILPARLDRAGAVERFHRRRWGNLFGLLPNRPVKVDEQGQAASLELVWMPSYAYRFSMMYKGKPVQSWVSIDASFGGFALLGRVKELVEGTMEGEIFPDILGPEQAESLAREGVVRYILRKRGPKPTVNNIEEHFHFHAPVWVYYFRTAGGKIDLAVLDAYSGDSMGGLVRRAIVEGFIAKRRETAGSETN